MTIPVPRETGRTGMTQRESGVLRACLDVLAAEKIWHRRWNTGAVKDGKRFFRFGRKGDADILAIRRYFDQGAWRELLEPVWIETKATRGKQTADQREFQREVEAEGHTYLLVRDAAELQAWLKDQGHK
jgi:hypothetical protein